MKIQYKKDYVLITTSSSKVALGKALDLKADDAEIFIANSVNVKGDTSDKLIVDKPGEYELHGVMVQAIPNTGTSDIILFSLDIERVNVVYISNKVKALSKRIIDQIGVNNILLISLDDEIDGNRDLIEDIDPNYVVPLTRDGEKITKLSKKLSVEVPDTEKSLSVNDSTFEASEEDTIFQLVVLA